MWDIRNSFPFSRGLQNRAGRSHATGAILANDAHARFFKPRLNASSLRFGERWTHECDTGVPPVLGGCMRCQIAVSSGIFLS